MALLQDPVRALSQIEKHLDNRSNDASRSVDPGGWQPLPPDGGADRVHLVCLLAHAEGEVPEPKGQLKILNELFQALDSSDPTTGRAYWTAAKRRGERIAKLARLRGKLRLWRKWFNEPSHDSAPGQRQKIGEKQIREFAKELGTTLDALDFGLVVAAHNEIMSGGSIRYPPLEQSAHRRPGAEPLERIRADLRWSGREDSNLRHPAPKAGALPGCATPRCPAPGVAGGGHPPRGGGDRHARMSSRRVTAGAGNWQGGIRVA